MKRVPILLCLLALSSAGCSLRRYALRATADALSGQGGAMAEDHDPELVAGAAPFGLKTMEQLARELPDHKGLRLSLASGFTQFSYAFVQQEADRAEDQDFKRAQAGWLRARRLYLRARDYALDGLELAHRGLRQALLGGDAARREAALREATKEDVPLLYWAGASWALAVSTGKDSADLIGDLPAVEAIMERALQLDEGYDRGALHEFFVSYDATRGKERGGGPEKVRQHLARAQALSGGTRLGVLVAYAEGLLVQQQSKAEFTRVLTQVAETDIERPEPAWRRERLANTISQRRARFLLSRTSELFAE
jgi:predicted anti-sigma-YlaC factor YlaD